MTRLSAAAKLIGIAACLLNLHFSCPAPAQEIGRFDASGVVVVERVGEVLRVTIPTEYGRITVEVGTTATPIPDVPGGGPVPDPPKPEPEPDYPDTWEGLADHLLRDVPAADRRPVATAIWSALEVVISPPPGNPKPTDGSSAAALLIDVATLQIQAVAPGSADSALMAIARAGDVLVKAGDDAALAVRFAKALKPRMQEIANGG